jgi:anti-sigma factor RsiW
VRCSEIQDQLTRRSAATAELEAHLGSCPACSRYAARLAHARAILAREGAAVPDPGFSRRVVARIPGSAQLLGWAALRALPAAIAIALAIGAFGLFQTPTPESSLLKDASSEALFAYAALPSDAGAQSAAPEPAPVSTPVSTPVSK